MWASFVNKVFVPSRDFKPVAFWEVAIVCVLALACVGLNYSWMSGDCSLPSEHSGRSLQDCLLFWQQVSHGEFFRPYHYPPLIFAVSSLGFLCEGPSLKVACYSLLIFIIPCVLSCWYIGRYIGGLWGGFIAALVTCGNMWLAYYSHGYFFEVALSAFVLMAYAFYLASDNFSRPLPAILFGVACGLGMLVKWSFLFFVLPLWLLPIFSICVVKGKKNTQTFTFRSGQEDLSLTFDEAGNSGSFNNSDLAEEEPDNVWGDRIMWLLGATCVTVMICGWWYAYSFQELVAKGVRDSGQHSAMLECLKVMLSSLFSGFWLSAPLFLVGSLIGFSSPRLKSLTFAVNAAIFFALTVYTLAQVPPVPRYMLPGSLLVSTLAYAWLGRIIYSGAIFTALVGVVAFIQVASFSLVSAPQPSPDPLPRRIGFDFAARRFQPLTLSRFPAPDSSSRAKQEQVFCQKLAQVLIKELASKDEHRLTCLVLPQSRLDGDNLILQAMLQGQSIDIEYYLPGHFEFVPVGSLLLVNGGNLSQADDKSRRQFTHYRTIATFKSHSLGCLSLCRNDKKQDNRPERGKKVKKK